MSRGRLLAQGPRASIAPEREVVVVTTRTSDADAARGVLASLGLEVAGDASGPAHVADPGTADGIAELRAELSSQPVAAITPALVAARLAVLGVRTERPSLEDTFVELTGEGFDVAR